MPREVNLTSQHGRYPGRWFDYCPILGANNGSRAWKRQLWSTYLSLRLAIHFPPNRPRYTSWISGMGGPDANIREFRRLGIGSHLRLGPFLRPLPGRMGEGRGGHESGDLDTLSYPSRGRDSVHDVADPSRSAMPSAQQRRKIFASATMKLDRMVRRRGRSGMGSNIAWHRRHNDCESCIVSCKQI